VSYFSLIVKSGHLEIECLYLKIESDETENPNEIEDNPEIEKEKNHEAELISALEELRKEREENMSLKKELMKQKESVHIFEESQ
jgi:F0F1-type ATP synthase epsilon subunit